MLVSPLGTYAAAVASIPRDIVEVIERSLPCPESANRQHMWDEEQVWSLAGPGRRWWVCTYCGLTSLTNPIPVADRPYPLVRSASDTYGTHLLGTIR